MYEVCLKYTAHLVVWTVVMDNLFPYTLVFS